MSFTFILMKGVNEGYEKNPMGHANKEYANNIIFIFRFMSSTNVQKHLR